ncbi:hypothetical protein [Leptolyngbya sp. FACHB-16]|uniref:hypothetical protein n=1 Tax=unclassified Leptolyngbya TaxID=2650499 RepID=UPI001688FE23|nr:hypothetical protein [Leptolyngbya sp. FACHB-16]MBD2155229.1 hypothetical protein [Leptolyngbya sp. FACHB-16]
MSDADRNQDYWDCAIEQAIANTLTVAQQKALTTKAKAYQDALLLYPATPTGH